MFRQHGLRQCVIVILAACAPAASVQIARAQNAGDQPDDASASTFEERVDLSPLAQVAVQDTGRLKSFDSFARNAVRSIAGSRSIGEQDPTFTYLDLLFRPEQYGDEPIIYVKYKLVRQRIGQLLEQAGAISAETKDTLIEDGKISPLLLEHPIVVRLLDQLQRDLMRTAKAVNQIRGGQMWANPSFLASVFRIVPPPSGDPNEPWMNLQEAIGGASAGMPTNAAHAGVNTGVLAQAKPELAAKLSSAWSELQAAWRAQDAPRASSAVAAFAGLLSESHAGVYPDANRLAWESWYFRNYNLTWIWVIYLLAIVPLLMSVVYRWSGARWIGLGLFLLAFGMHTFALGLRWYVAERWPNSNMFEAVTTAAWFGGVVALVLEVVARKTALRNLFALGSAGASMAAMMAGYYLPVSLNAHIGNMMPVLHDVWLYIHTNVIIASYCLIAMAAVSALLYLVYRVFGGDRKVAKAGGAGSLIMQGADGKSFLMDDVKTTAGQVLDAATMILMELSFVLLWAGIVMGAIWADHSWGRPWGWDPKEVFALNTFVIFLLLVHVRVKVVDKGLWTALLAVLGCGVMLFNWIVVNFVISGLHSYA